MFRASDYLRTLVANLLHSSGPTARVSIVLQLADLSWDFETAIPCGLIVNELLSNALKHAFPSGAGTVRLELRGGDGGRGCVLTISDDGVGLPASIDLRRTDSLGLWLVRTLADQLGASVHIERMPGTTFTISVPAV